MSFSLDPASLLLTLLTLFVLGLKVFAFADALRHPAPAYVAHGKLTKPAWLAILGLSVLLGLVSGLLGLFGIVTIVATVVYLVDVRPALRGE